MKWILAVLIAAPFPLVAQLPIPISPDWLKSGDAVSGVLHTTEVQLLGNNYRVVQTNITAQSGGFRILGFITLKSPSYVTAMSRLYARAGFVQGSPQALANVVHETGGLNLILFSLPKIRVRADLVEFTGPPLPRRGAAETTRDGQTEEPEVTRTRSAEAAVPPSAESAAPESDGTRESLRRALGQPER